MWSYGHVVSPLSAKQEVGRDRKLADVETASPLSASAEQA